MVNTLIGEIKYLFEEVNKERLDLGEEPLNVSDKLCVLEQGLSDDSFKSMFEELNRYGYDVYFRNEEDESGIGFTNYNKIELYIRDTSTSYIISFDYVEKWWGYCQCSKDDEGYDVRHKCCGHNCDWYAPRIIVTKEIILGHHEFRGCEHDLWDYRDKYNNVTIEDKAEQEKLAKIMRLKEERKRIELEIKQLEMR